jgi:hypothetical protein
MRPISNSIVAAATALLLASCATSGPPAPASMPAARAALRPEFRIFYDALADYGDWVLIEPYGFVFRPGTDFLWRPYEDGFWAPTDAYGWVWISSEPFGWATYHYGSWFYDRYQGWVWQPGLDWGPAWVTWQVTDDMVGWSPLLDVAASDAPRGGAFVYAPIHQLGSTNLRASVQTAENLGEAVSGARVVNNTVDRDGVRIRLGPRIEGIERAIGMPLTRVLVDDMVPVNSALVAQPPAGTEVPGLDETMRAAQRAAREAKALSERGGRSPARLPVVRPLGVPVPGRFPATVGRKARTSPGTRDTAKTP